MEESKNTTELNAEDYRRDAMGRYSRSGDISEDLEKLMNKTDDERVKDEIRRLMERM